MPSILRFYASVLSLLFFLFFFFFFAFHFSGKKFVPQTFRYRTKPLYLLLYLNDFDILILALQHFDQNLTYVYGFGINHYVKCK